MKNKLKTELQSAFNPPQSNKKDSFIRNFNYPKASYYDFLLYQIGYIRKRVWCASVLLLVGAWLALKTVDSNSFTYEVLWELSSILPFIALLAVTEILSSTSFNMAELEMTTRFSLGNILLTRMCILGIANLFVFLIILAAMSFKVEYSFFRLGVYLLLPYLLTCFGSLLILNKSASKETVYYCAGVSCSVSILNILVANSKTIIYSDNFVYLWVAISIQGVKFIKKTEELQWNLLLID